MIKVNCDVVAKSLALTAKVAKITVCFYDKNTLRALRLCGENTVSARPSNLVDIIDSSL